MNYIKNEQISYYLNKIHNNKIQKTNKNLAFICI
jgi:hypothetical protein